jgi:hypothetical protein
VTLNAASGSQPISLSVVDNQLTLVPRNKLLPLTRYSANVAGVRGVSGQTLAAPVSTSFTTRDGAWQSAHLITHRTNLIFQPPLVENASGAAFLMGLELGSTTNTVVLWASRYLPGLGWSAPVNISAEYRFDGTPPVIAVDQSGNALALWSSNDGSHQNLWANHYTSGKGWATAEVIVDGITAVASEPQIAFDASNNAFVVWRQYNNSTGKNGIYAVRYNVAAGWGIPEQIDKGLQNINVYAPAIAFDAQGNATSIWQCDAGNNIYEVCSNRYTAGIGWASPGLLLSSFSATCGSCPTEKRNEFDSPSSVRTRIG